MPAPETTARAAIIDLLAAEFAAEQFPIKDDKLHASVGHKGTTIGVYVDRTISSPRDRYIQEIDVVVQFYGRYDLKVDPEQTVSPSVVEGYADRFRNALRTRRPDPHTGAVGYFVLVSVIYPDDPTGNKTRFEAHLTAYGNNGAQLVETSG